ncbi:sensor domain-containing diguanylate cyclase [Saccharospirillum impatiens]|uniref:sensor domain-containing diguanylate cyclase n=1 Tax=Saccharospirillum impatiens TaxID=169438 RepID=UPI00041CFAEC|nr:MHYT domain-containing protein [Saccharospirillum impatiens]
MSISLFEVSMEGSYDISLVSLSYLVAILASYCALYFGTQLTRVEGTKRKVWLILGSLSMGLGVWSMHFIGMGAYQMDMPMTYDLTMTVVSWVAAVLASGLALFLISKSVAGVGVLLLGSLVMGLGIAVMHYLGMAAMRITPSVSYDPVWFTLSIVIAVGASGAALAICRYTQRLVGRQAVGFQGIAALVMGAAICGMHYSGMVAVIYPPGAMPAMSNQLTGSAIGTPVVGASVLFIIFALLAVYSDIKARNSEEEWSRQETERVKKMAFEDEATGLPNRSRLEHHLLESLVETRGSASPFTLIMLEMANYRELSAGVASETLSQRLHALAEQIQKRVPGGVYLARYSNSTFGLVVHDAIDSAAVKQTFDKLGNAATVLKVTGWNLNWKAGYSRFPQTGHSSRMLIREALKTAPLSQLSNDKAPATESGVQMLIN